MADDDGMCCAEITIATRAFRALNGHRDPATWLFVLHVERVDGYEFPLIVNSVERVVELVQGLNPRLVHIGATDDERAGLMADLGACIAEKLAAQVAAPTDQPAHVLH